MIIKMDFSDDQIKKPHQINLPSIPDYLTVLEIEGEGITREMMDEIIKKYSRYTSSQTRYSL